MRSRRLILVLLATFAAHGQNDDPAKAVFNKSKDSVFLVYLNDSTGKPSALGSAFVVAPHLLITNAHVADAGSPVLAVGPIRVPLKVLRSDEKNDLALLSVDIDLTSTPLALASAQATPGEEVFAIGNPEGLENTISQGIVSGLRKMGDRDLVQITSPISHGSSGGPILNANGEVVGVAVGMLEDGQNLNFAVPVSFVRALMAQTSTPSLNVTGCAQRIDQINSLITKRSQETYSDDSSSDYQKDTRQLTNLADKTADNCEQPDVLRSLACLGTQSFDVGGSSIKAAQKLVAIKPSPESHAILAYVLYDSAETESFIASLAKDGSPERDQANQAYKTLANQAEREASQITKQATGYSLQVADYVLAGIKKDNNDFRGASSLHSVVASSAPNICGQDLRQSAYLDLVDEADKSGQPDQSEEWFKQYASRYQPAAFQWDAEGDRRWKSQDFATSAIAYEHAASIDKAYDYDYCYAAVAHDFKESTEGDIVLADGRKCIDASVTDTRDSAKGYFQEEVPVVYRDMSSVLESRGVYDQALEYVKESLAAKPDNAWALYYEAKIFDDLHRTSECTAAAKAAIRASDGKYSTMHFVLGSCFFQAEDWAQAADSFRIAAMGDKTDAAAAYNLGLSLDRQGFTADARQWFHEALRRNPDDETKAKILSSLQ